VTLRGAGFESGHSLLAAAGARLDALQAQDGHWANEGSHERDVDTTLDALYALRRVGLL
jgi:hypothetical protein